MSLDDLTARATIAAVFACGLIGASPLAIAGGVLVLTSLRTEACQAFAYKYGTALGQLEAGCLFAAAAAARNALVCTVAYAAGTVLAIVVA